MPETNKKLFYSVIIPVFNRPDEVKELLESLVKQTNKNFELIIIEDGSKEKCADIVKEYSEQLDVKYFYKDNSGPGQSRNYGAERAKYDYFIFFDSDCIIPDNYFETVTSFLEQNYADAYGGPDAAHESFSNLQKSISYAMTSFFTTGGIRGSKKSVEKFHPRSFNMGFSRKVFEKTTGYSKMRFGEDIDLSLRIFENDFSAVLINDAFVYHKRRTDFRKFFKQVYNSGIARINLYKKHSQSLKIIHFFPSAFVIGTIGIIALSFYKIYFILPILLYILLVFTDSSIKNKSVKIGFLSIIASFVQLASYGTGFIVSFWKRIILRQSEFQAFKNNFYK